MSRRVPGVCLFAGLFLLVFCGVAVPRLGAEIVDQIVAIVNDDTITYSEMRKILNPIYSQYQKVCQGEDLLNKMIKAKSEVLNQLVENKLLVQEARRRDIQIHPKEIDDHIDKIRSRFSSADEFEKVMLTEGMTLDQLRHSVEEQYLVRARVQQELAPRAVIGPSEIEDYYKANQSQFCEEQMVQASHIMVKNVPAEEGAKNGVDQAFEKIKEASAELKKGEPFDLVAKKYSQAPDSSSGGDMGFFSKGRMLKEIDDAAFSLNVGQTSEIIKSAMGYHIIKVTAKRAARTIPMAEIQKEIEQELFQQKTEALRKQLVEELKVKAYVKILE